MKKVIFLAAMCPMALTMNAQSYVDLGLPSGTKWKTTNEKNATDAEYDFYTYDEAVSQFGNRLPSKEQWEELKTKCQWSRTDSGRKVTGPNGNSISLPAAGYRNCDGSMGYEDALIYWSSTPCGSWGAWYLYDNSFSVCMGDDGRCNRLSVRLVQDDYVDLGLPSGTKWKTTNEKNTTDAEYDFYSYEDAVSQFGNRLPTIEQWYELEVECQWLWTGSGCKVIGPNGNSIYLPAAGCHYTSSSAIGVESFGDYWSSTPGESVYAWKLHFSSEGVSTDETICFFGQSVRLVQD